MMAWATIQSDNNLPAHWYGWWTLSNVKHPLPMRLFKREWWAFWLGIKTCRVKTPLFEFGRGY